MGKIEQRVFYTFLALFFCGIAFVIDKGQRQACREEAELDNFNWSYNLFEDCVIEFTPGHWVYSETVHTVNRDKNKSK